MWKFSGSPRSASTSHSGSQWSSPRSGRPWFWGSALVLTPLKPSSLIRRTSVTAASMSHQGRSPSGTGGRPSRSWISAMASFQMRTTGWRSSRSRRPGRSAARRSRPRSGRRSGPRCRGRPSPRGEARRWTPGMGVLEVPAHELRPARLRPVALDHPAGAGPAEHGVTERPRRHPVDVARPGARGHQPAAPGRPQIVRLGEVGVGIDDVDALQPDRIRRPLPSTRASDHPRILAAGASIGRRRCRPAGRVPLCRRPARGRTGDGEGDAWTRT